MAEQFASSQCEPHSKGLVSEKPRFAISRVNAIHVPSYHARIKAQRLKKPYKPNLANYPTKLEFKKIFLANYAVFILASFLVS